MHNGLYRDGFKEPKKREFNYNLLKCQPPSHMRFSNLSTNMKQMLRLIARSRVEGFAKDKHCCNVTAHLWTKRQFLYVPLPNYIHPWVEQADSNEA
jgi:hypothetical protein